ncbi:MAG: glycosyltransferase family 39 protein, partial [Candidatus Omnitrophica bacterium]|nr:glycosyltransferase family 39 protein [Candidatus Omnitrophota bacterium]
YHLAKNLLGTFPQYHTQEFVESLEKLRPELAPYPSYFKDPLFKHPPLFFFFAALSMKILGANYLTVFYVANFFGILIIFAIYFLAKLITHQRSLSLMAAFAVWMDPINIICSQKIWIDTMLSFWQLLAIIFFIHAIQSQKSNHFLWSGFCAGLATLTKYPGILITLGILLYVTFYNRTLFKNKRFIVSLLLPLLMLSPWLSWNFATYGINFISNIMNVEIGSRGILILFYGIGGMLLLVLFLKYMNRQILKYFSWLIVGCLSFALLKNLLASLDLTHLPSTSWAGGLFSHENHLFYLGRLLELSPLYIFALIAMIFPSQNKNLTLLKVISIVILIFYSWWGDYQSRYILAATPYLILLAIILWKEFLKKSFQLKCKSLRLCSQSLLIVSMLFVFWKTYLINVMISFPNNLCYF